MPSPEALAEIGRLRARSEAPAATLDEARAAWAAEAAAEPLPEGTQISAETIGGIACERVTAPGVAPPAGAQEAAEWAALGALSGGAPGAMPPGNIGLIVLLHGGGYVSGSPVTHRKLAAHLSAASRLPVIVPDYRLAPEHPFPAGLDDAHAVWQALTGGGLGPERIVLCGDSAGGGLALALMLRLKAEGAAQPAGAALLSPWTDLLSRGDSFESNRDSDPSMTRQSLMEAAAHYTGEADPLDPLLSPVEAELGGLPPLLVHVGGNEIMLSDSLALVRKAETAGVSTTLTLWDGLWHVHQHALPQVPEAAAAVAEIAAFARERLEL
ncbi:alpha/beta hydrolase [Pseudoroseicyclus sp. CXY001]|uniref:alpha/beta hydrolase n=1 Tax=Pseudoroseicyclus sp. CXY001 TaxID=3242492 RepID=UPI00357119BA